MLREESFSLNGRGKIQIQQKFVPIDANIRFAFSMYGRAIGRAIELNCSGEEWHAFKNALAIRNRIVHPKSADELSITDDELACVRKATNWILATTLLESISSLLALREEYDRLKTVLRDGKI